MSDKENYEEFFKEIRKFKEKQNKQKQRGLNNYNMVNVVRSERSEVGMHSNVIISLIDPHGLHYQGSLFLDLFIKHVLVESKDFGDVFEVQAEESTDENRRIDFTIKSDKYFIGIEMKIDAGDLDNQIFDYEKDLIKKAKKFGLNKDNVKIYYLTKDGKDAKLRSKENKDRTKITEIVKISFQKHILKWVIECQKEVKNITNLNEALENYKNIVKKITNQYKGSVVTLEKYLIDNETKKIKKEYINILDKIDSEQGEYVKYFMKKVEEQFASIPNSRKIIDKDIIDFGIKTYENKPNIVIRFIKISEKLVCQVLPANIKFEFQPSMMETKDKQTVFNCLKNINKDFNKGWKESYGVLELGYIRIQNGEDILEKIVNLEKKLEIELSII